MIQQFFSTILKGWIGKIIEPFNLSIVWGLCIFYQLTTSSTKYTNTTIVSVICDKIYFGQLKFYHLCWEKKSSTMVSISMSNFINEFHVPVSKKKKERENYIKFKWNFKEKKWNINFFCVHIFYRLNWQLTSCHTH